MRLVSGAQRIAGGLFLWLRCRHVSSDSLCRCCRTPFFPSSLIERELVFFCIYVHLFNIVAASYNCLETRSSFLFVIYMKKGGEFPPLSLLLFCSSFTWISTFLEEEKGFPLGFFIALKGRTSFFPSISKMLSLDFLIVKKQRNIACCTLPQSNNYTSV